MSSAMFILARKELIWQYYETLGVYHLPNPNDGKVV